MTAPCQGGVAGSSAPLITSVGAVTEGSEARWSIAPIASQQPAYPSGSTSRIAPTRAATAAGSRCRNAAVNHLPADWSATGPIPWARTSAARSAQPRSR